MTIIIFLLYYWLIIKSLDEEVLSLNLEYAILSSMLMITLALRESSYGSKILKSMNQMCLDFDMLAVIEW